MAATFHGKLEKVKGLKSEPGDGGNRGVAPLSAEQQRLKWNATIAAMCLDATPGIYVGSSTWVDHMNKVVPS
eukprot:2814305-Pyramimonas_sp.AAC.1